MSYDEDKDLCGEAWEDEDSSYLYGDRSQKQSEGQ